MNDEPPNSSPDPGAFEGRGTRRPESPYPKAELLPRLLARLTDLIFAGLLAALAGRTGEILAVLYLLFADGMFAGQSPGKRLLGIKVVCLPSRLGADYRESALRNFPLGAVLLLDMLPAVGPFAAGALGLAVAAFEGWRVRTDPLGLRMGDLFAGTQVIDTKVFGGVQVRPVLKAVPGGRVGTAQVLHEPSRSLAR